MPIDTIDHDEWNYSLKRLPRGSKITLPDIYGVLPFDGVRNPGSRSSVAHRVWWTYRVEANNWQPKVGICESSAEWACATQILLHKDTYDLKLQPLTVEYKDDDGVKRKYTHDILFQTRSGESRLVFVRNSKSLEKQKVWRQIEKIIKATPKGYASDMAVVNADAYTRQRRENLFRMLHCIEQPDPEADDWVLDVIRTLKSIWHMKDIFPHVPLPQPRVFAACYRMVAQGVLRADLDKVLWEHSRVELAR